MLKLYRENGERNKSLYHIPWLLPAWDKAMRVLSAVELNVTVVRELSMTRFFSDVRRILALSDWWVKSIVDKMRYNENKILKTMIRVMHLNCFSCWFYTFWTDMEVFSFFPICNRRHLSIWKHIAIQGCIDLRYNEEIGINMLINLILSGFFTIAILANGVLVWKGNFCLGDIAPLENCSLIWRCHLYWCYRVADFEL